LSTAELATAAAIVRIGLGLGEVVTMSKTVTACACIARRLVLGELTTTGTVAGTSADNAFTFALAVRIVERVDEGAKSLLTNEVAVFAVAIASTVTADIVHAEVALALIVATAGHTVSLERLALT